MLFAVLDERAWRPRLLLGALGGVGFFAVSLFWFGEFTGPGAVLGVIVEALFLAAAAVAVPRTGAAARAVAFPAALLLAEGARDHFPFGGVPIGGLQLGQAGGPLLAVARVGGPLLIVATVAVAAVVIAGRGVRVRVAASAFAVAIAAASAVAPAGTTSGRTITVGAVQGGGRRGLRAWQSDPGNVYQAHLAATDQLRGPVDLIVWPENVIDVVGNVAGQPEAAELAALATRLHATVVAGVVEGHGTDQFRNAAVAWSPDGALVGRYEKVHRVPFGEYVPLRALIKHVADLSNVPDDAIVGVGPNLLATPAGRLGVAISYEVFFADRGRAAVANGAGLMLVPTNAASFSTSQVPSQELAAARLLAVETGRTVVQAGPTGYTAIIDARGSVRARSTLGRRQVLQARVALRTGRTLYARWGDPPLLAIALVALAAAWLVPRRRATR